MVMMDIRALGAYGLFCLFGAVETDLASVSSF